MKLKICDTLKATYLTFKMNVFNHLNVLQTTVSLCLELKEDYVKIESLCQSILITDVKTNPCLQ